MWLPDAGAWRPALLERLWLCGRRLQRLGRERAHVDFAVALKLMASSSNVGVAFHSRCGMLACFEPSR